MADAPNAFARVRDLFEQLQRRRLPIGPPDLEALRLALTAGFGWSSRDALCELLVALWAKSPREADIVRAMFARLAWPEGWTPVPAAGAGPMPGTGRPAPASTSAGGTAGAPRAPPAPEPALDIQLSVSHNAVGIPPLTLPRVKIADARLMLAEQYPLTHREIAQAFRRLRKPMRFGPPSELDFGQTLQQRLRTGVSVPPVLVPRRRNAARLALFVDVEGSMAPYAPFVDAFCTAVREAGLLQQTSLHYFHDIPTEGTDRSLLSELDAGDFFPALDPVLSRIEPLDAGRVYADPQLENGQTLRALVAGMAPGTAALIISDAGAARGRADPGRVQDSLAFVKALRRGASSVVWLNPVPKPLWAHTVAAHLARHVPAYAMDREGIHLAVNALRGHPVQLERPL